MKLIISMLLFFTLISCVSTPKKEYSFFIAGHTYGNPSERAKNIGLYKPFKDKTAFINNQEKMKHGFLLGDVVWGQNFWKRTQKDISRFNMPIHISRGNHDGKLENFEKLFGKSYKKFFNGKDLFVILDLNLDHWNISGEQLTFLRNLLRIDAKKARNIFIFSHQILWFDKEKYSEPVPNSLYDRSERTNYWSEIEPLLLGTNKPTFVFAGDVGAFSKEKRKRNNPIEYSYYKERGISYVTSGMGGGVRDNFIIIDVYSDNSVRFRLIHLNGENINSLGKLEDYNNPN